MSFQLELQLSDVRLRGHDHFWDVIRGYGVGGEFTVRDIVDETTAHKATVDDFVRRLTRAGLIERAGARAVGNPLWSSGKTVKAQLYRVLKTPRDTPSLRRDGTPGAYGEGRQCMWNIVRGPQAQAGIDALEVVALAETDTVSIALGTAKEYLLRLHDAGYLSVVEKAAHGRLTRYRLYPHMAGPKAPKLLNAKLVYDPNRRAVVGVALASEVTE